MHLPLPTIAPTALAMVHGAPAKRSRTAQDAGTLSPGIQSGNTNVGVDIHERGNDNYQADLLVPVSVNPALLLSSCSIPDK